MNADFINLAYLAAAVLFILGIRGMTHPRTAVRGNLLGASAMLLAVVVTLLDQDVVEFQWIALGLIIGTIIGIVLAVRIQMTDMPQMVALLNGFGGAASFVVAGAELIRQIPSGELVDAKQVTIAIAASGIIGSITLTGSLVAFAKLQGLISGNAISFVGQQIVNALLGLAALGLSISMTIDPSGSFYWALVVVAAVLGVLLVTPIGGADMPVVIALLNSYSGLAAAATGFVIDNSVLIIAGSLVGASGLILTRIMCVAMNRSLFNVLFGVMGEGGEVADADEVYAGKVKSVSAEEAAMIFESARRVVIVPGYGLAVSQGQHAVRDLANLLESRSCQVQFAIHPVAGRMPGHMNVLLAEANVDYDKMIEMDAINPQFEQIDVVLVIGANDVVNPLARTDPNSPIAGMPVLDVDKARTVIIVKRSLSPGFAGIPNPLFAADNALMLYGDAQKTVLDLIAALEEA